MSAEDLKALVATRMQQAAECIADGRFLLAAGRGPRTAINRAYYAAFYAVLALLQTVGKTPRKHSGVLSLFDTEFVKPGLLVKSCRLIYTASSTRARKTTTSVWIPLLRRRRLKRSPWQTVLPKLYAAIWPRKGT